MAGRSGATQDDVRRQNVSALLRQVHRSGAQSRAQLTASMGLNRSTIKALVGELADAELVGETIPDTGVRAGRPSHVVAPRSDSTYALAANVGVGGVTVAAIGLGGKTLARREYAIAGPGIPAEAVAKRLGGEFRRLQAKLPSHARLVGVGVSLPGVVRPSDGWVEFAPNLMWRDVPFGDVLAKHFDGGDARIANEGDLGAVAEHARGSGQGVPNLVYLSSEVGIGGGIIVDGRLVTGSQGYAGEVGHMVVNPGGRRCRCGARGCFETEAGEDAVLVACGREAGSGRAGLREVFDAARRGEKAALDGLHTRASWLARGVATLVNIFDPDIVILGGPLSSLFFLTGDAISVELATLCRFTGPRGVRLAQPGLGHDSSLIGAAELAFEPLLDDPLHFHACPPRGDDRRN